VPAAVASREIAGSEARLSASRSRESCRRGEGEDKNREGIEGGESVMWKGERRGMRALVFVGGKPDNFPYSCSRRHER